MMSVSSRSTLRRRTLAAAAATAVLALTLAACGSSASSTHSDAHSSGNSSMSSATNSATSSATNSAVPGMPGTPGMSGMPGMGTGTPMAMAAGNGLAAEQDGYRLDAPSATLAAGQPVQYRFSITGPDGKPVTDFAVEQTEQLHFYAIRSDLTGYQHVHPVLAADGGWTADLAPLRPGSWRLYASFTPNSGSGKGTDFVLSRTVTVPGPAADAAADTPLPPAASSTTVDGYTATVQGELMAGMAHPLTITISKDGQPVTDLQPYLDSYAHLSAFHAGDQAFAHLHPESTVNGDHGGPSLAFHAEPATAGDWRLFLQFRTAGQLHTAALTLHVD
ncbi:hypothetical protein ACFZB9_34655 [Kitasatospora sp. NPDC008050]|uniref:hypothetical protein n=1 Tax=Kitasatospora sp. NPDC008050 TaxID=3364021 RepID=UPI0036E37F16